MSRELLTGVALAASTLVWASPALLATSSAYANPFELRLSESGYSTQTVVGITPGVSYSGSFGTFTVSIDGGISTTLPQIDLGSTDLLDEYTRIIDDRAVGDGVALACGADAMADPALDQ